MEVLALQLLFMGVIFACTSFIGAAPILFGKIFKRKLSLTTETTERLLSDASCFGAGVFLFVCFLGLLPEADKKFHSILEEWENSDRVGHTFAEFPWGFFIVTVGFLIIFSIDKFVHALHDAKSQRNKEAASKKTLISVVPSTETKTISQDPLTVHLQSNAVLNYDCHVEVCGVADEESTHGVPSSLMFLVALGVHSVFEGIAVGLQDSIDKTTEYSVAILLHEVVMSLTFGLEVRKSKFLSRNMKLLYVFIFTSSIPVGMGIGLGLKTSSSDHQELVSAIIEAFATGIFLHVIFIEILGNEFGHNHVARHKCRLISAREDQPERVRNNSSQIVLIIEKIISICLGFTLLIIMNVFMAGHGH